MALYYLACLVILLFSSVKGAVVNPREDLAGFLVELLDRCDHNNYDGIMDLFTTDSPIYHLLDYSPVVGVQGVRSVVESSLFSGDFRRYYYTEAEGKFSKGATAHVIYTSVVSGLWIASYSVLQFDGSGRIKAWVEMITSDIEEFDGLDLVPDSFELLPRVFVSSNDAAAFENAGEIKMEKAIREADRVTGFGHFVDPRVASSDPLVIVSGNIAGTDYLTLESFLESLYMCGANCDLRKDLSVSGRRSMVVPFSIGPAPGIVFAEGHCLVQITSDRKVSTNACHL